MPDPQQVRKGRNPRKRLGPSEKYEVFVQVLAACRTPAHAVSIETAESVIPGTEALEQVAGLF